MDDYTFHQNRIDKLASAMREHAIKNGLSVSPDNASWDALPETRKDLWRGRAEFVLDWFIQELDED